MAKANIQAIIFDLDGTLVDSYDLLIDSFRYSTQTVLGRTIPDEVLMAGVGRPLVDQMQEFAANDAERDQLVQAYRLHNDEVHDTLIKVFPHTISTLDALKAAGLQLGVVTSKRHVAAVRGLHCFNLENYFEFIISPDDWPEHKPQPGPILHGCELIGADPQTCIYVGDSPYDIQAGNAAGCETIAALWGMFSREVLLAENPTYVCSDMSEIPELVLGSAAQ